MLEDACTGTTHQETTASPVARSDRDGSRYPPEAIKQQLVSIVAIFKKSGRTHGEYLLRSILRAESTELPTIDIHDRPVATARRPGELKCNGDVCVCR